jgi:hypothetical protein
MVGNLEAQSLPTVLRFSDDSSRDLVGKTAGEKQPSLRRPLSLKIEPFSEALTHFFFRQS